MALVRSDKLAPMHLGDASGGCACCAAPPEAQPAIVTRSNHFKMRSDGSAAYTVQPGDTMSKIAREALVSASGDPRHKPTEKQALHAVQRIARANNFEPHDIHLIKPDVPLIIPKDVIGRSKHAGVDQRETVRKAQVPQTSGTERALSLANRFTFEPDGSATYKIVEGDTLSKIARQSLIAAKADPGFKPTEAQTLEAVSRIAVSNGIAIKDINGLKPDANLSIPTDVIGSLRQPKDRVPVEGSKVLDNAGGSEAFVKRVKDSIDQLPAEVRRLIEENNVKVITVGELADFEPNLARSRPRGWPVGSTWANADGLCRGNVVVISENTRDRFGALHKSDRTQGVINHEIGHAVDAAFREFSHGAEFTAAYQKDVEKLPREGVVAHGYLLQGDGDASNFAGREEAFADVFAALKGSAANKDDTAKTLKDFPSSSTAIAQRLDTLKLAQLEADIVKVLFGRQLPAKKDERLAVDDAAMRKFRRTTE